MQRKLLNGCNKIIIEKHVQVSRFKIFLGICFHTLCLQFNFDLCAAVMCNAMNSSHEASKLIDGSELIEDQNTVRNTLGPKIETAIGVLKQMCPI